MRKLVHLALHTGFLLAASGCSNPQEDAAAANSSAPQDVVARTEADLANAASAAQAKKDTSVPQNGPLIIDGISLDIWGSYKIHHVLFPQEEWTFFIVVVPKNIGQGTLIKVAKTFYSKYPNTRVRFFSDTKNIQQYLDRDKYINDSTGTVKEVDFPDDEWVQNHLLGNINNRSKTHNRHWMLENRYGDNLALLP